MLSRSAIRKNQGLLQTKSGYTRHTQRLTLNLPMGYIPKIRSSEFKTHPLMETLLELVLARNLSSHKSNPKLYDR